MISDRYVRRPDTRCANNACKDIRARSALRHLADVTTWNNMYDKSMTRFDIHVQDRTVTSHSHHSVPWKYTSQRYMINDAITSVLNATKHLVR